MKVNIEYSKDKEQIHIMWKVDTKRKQKLKLSSYLETETHFGIMRQFFSQIDSDLILACDCYTDCDFNRLKGYQDQTEVVEIVSCLEDKQHMFTYKLKDFSIPLVAIDIVKAYNLDIELNVNFEGL